MLGIVDTRGRWSLAVVTMALAGLSAVPPEQALPAEPLSISEAKSAARRTVAKWAHQQDAAGYRVGPCSRLSPRRVNCDSYVYGLDYDIACRGYVKVKLSRGNIYTQRVSRGCS